MNTYDKYLGQTLDERYEILERIGEGGMAVVYKALDHRLNRYVAVKIMRDEMAEDEEFRRRFSAESHAVAMLSNPNIVAVYETNRVCGFFHFSSRPLPSVPGVNIRIPRSCLPLPASEAARCNRRRNLETCSCFRP